MFRDPSYVVCGIDEAEGTIADDVTPTRAYFELGWEVVTTHFAAKRFLKDGSISRHCTIVTCHGREFLYSSVFPHVIDYRAFTQSQGALVDEARWLTRDYDGGRFPDGYISLKGGRRTYRYLREDAEIIRNISVIDPSELQSLHDGQPFACLVVRRRSHGPGRNMSAELAVYLLNLLLRRMSRVFVVGHGAEDLAGYRGVSHVDLKTYASLI